MLQYGLVAFLIALFTVVAIALIESGGGRQGRRRQAPVQGEMSQPREHPPQHT